LIDRQITQKQVRIGENMNHTILIIAILIMALYYTGNLVISLINAYRRLMIILASILLRSVSVAAIVAVMWSLA